MTARRTDNPRKKTVLLSEDALRLLDGLAHSYAARDGGRHARLSDTDTLERGIRELARRHKLT
jgi:hypothetical protein